MVTLNVICCCPSVEENHKISSKSHGCCVVEEALRISPIVFRIRCLSGRRVKLRVKKKLILLLRVFVLSLRVLSCRLSRKVVFIFRRLGGRVGGPLICRLIIGVVSVGRLLR